MKKGFIVAIDGPVASGKGTIANLLAQHIHGVNFNTGGMWRALALKCMRERVEYTDIDTVLTFLTPDHIDITFDPKHPYSSIVLLDGVNIEHMIYTPEVSMGASLVAKDERVQRKMADILRKKAQHIAKRGTPVVMEGRQIGSEVIPDADIKIFLTAHIKTRAQRRHDQYNLRDEGSIFDDVLEQTRIRDEQDMSRSYGGLVRNPDDHGYVVLDNSDMDEKQTLSVIIDSLKQKKLIN